MNPKTTAIIVIGIILFVILLIANQVYVENDYDAIYLTCEYQSDYVEYSETLKFTYIEDEMYDFTRNEVFIDSKKHPVEDTYKEFKKVYDKVKDENSSDYKYIVHLKDKKLTIDTYIKVLKYPEKFDSYMAEKDISYQSKLDEVVSKLEKSYNCSIVKE